MDTTVCICTLDPVCSNQQTKVNQTIETSGWNGFRQLVRAIGEFALEILRSNNSPEPVLSNGGTRVLIRPDRFDLI